MSQGEKMDRSGLLYILENQVPVPTDNLLQWGQWMEDPNNKQVASTEIDELRVTTIFLGVDNNLTKDSHFSSRHWYSRESG